MTQATSPRTRIRASRRRRIAVVASIAAGAVVAVGAVQYFRGDHAGYPFSHHFVAGDARGLWSIAPADLDRALADDTARLLRAIAVLDRAVEDAEANAALLATRDVEALSAEERAHVRDLWSAFVEPLMAIEDLKRRYRGWFGLDYLKSPELHARAFAISFLSLCAELAAGQRFLALVAGNDRVQSLFDEQNPESGLPAGTFRAMRAGLGRVRDASLLPIASDWYDTWIARHLGGQGSIGELARSLDERRKRAAGAIGAAAIPVGRNKLEILKSEVFADLMPVQKGVAEWFGDTRTAPEGRRLIDDAQLHEMQKHLLPGDVIVERRNWYLSNVGLPGFWPHAALYVGTPAEIAATLDDDPAVVAEFGKLSEHLAKAYPKAFAELAASDDAGHAHRIVEAVSEGVVAASLEHSCGADYVAALRPRLPKRSIARAIDRALYYMGRPYDFDFDFATDGALVCSELVIKAYEPSGDVPGLAIPWITVVGKRAIPPTELVRAFAADRSDAGPLGFVYFLDGRERERRAVIGTEADLAGSIDRPKWDVLQP